MTNNTLVVIKLALNELFLFNLSFRGLLLISFGLFAFLLYSLGLLGMLFNYKNFLITMMSVELMYLGVISSFVFLSSHCDNVPSAIYSLALLILAACESAIGLGILIVIYRFGKSVAFIAYEQLGG